MTSMTTGRGAAGGYGRRLAAVVGIGAALMLGAFTAVIQHHPADPALLGKKAGGGHVTLGGQVTTTADEPTVLATPKAAPAVKATQFGKG